MKADSYYPSSSCNLQNATRHSHSPHQPQQNAAAVLQLSNPCATAFLTSDQLRRLRNSNGFSDRDSVCSGNSIRGRKIRPRIISMKSSKGVGRKVQKMDYTNYAYNEAVGRLKLMLADTYATPKGGGAYLRNFSEDSADNCSDNMSVIERPVFSDISKYLSPSQKSRITTYRPKKVFNTYSSSKENLSNPNIYQTATAAGATPSTAPLDYYMSPKPAAPLPVVADSMQAPVEIFNFIEKQEDYIEQLEKESKYCRNELSNLLGKVKDVIHENEQLTETARSELAALSGTEKHAIVSPSSDSEEVYMSKKPSTPRKKDNSLKLSPRYASAPNIVYEARISELEAELTQSNIDVKRLKHENEELKRKLANADPVLGVAASTGKVNCDTHRKQIEHLQMDKATLEETVRQLQKSLDDAKSQQFNSLTSKRYINDLMQMERSQAELEVKHLREELDRQHERVRELQHEMARRIAEERANAERRYNSQVDQLGGDLSSQWEQVAKLQLDLERQKRYETDLKRDVANKSAQIEELKMELRSNRSTFLADMAQVNAEKQSLEQEINSLRMQLDRALRDAKTESTRLNAEINSLRQRLDRGDADLLHSKREILRLNDEMANLEKELAYGEMKNEIRPTKKDLDKRMSEMQEKHAETVRELEEMIHSQKLLMDKLTNECKILTNKLEDATLKHNHDKQQLRDLNIKLLDRLKQVWASYKDLLTKGEAAIPSLTWSSRSTSDGGSSSEREEHFSERALNVVKPLSTTNRPHLAQPTPYAHSQITTNLVPTAMSPYLAKQEQQQQPQQEMIPSPQQALRQLQQRLPTILAATSPPSMSPQPPATVSAITSPATNMGSKTTMTKIERTPLVQEKRISNRNNNYPQQRTVMLQQEQLQNQDQEEEEVQVTLPNQATITARITALTTVKTTAHSTQPKRLTRTQTWPPPQVPNTQQPTTAAMKVTIHSNTTPAPMMPVRTDNTPVLSSMIPQDKAMIRVADKDMATTQQPTMIQMPINTTPQQLQHQYQQQQSLQQAVNLGRQHPHPPAQSQRPHLVDSPRTQLAVQQQMAARNRERAVELWGQQVVQDQAENPLCHNSLPRELPRSSYTEDNGAASDNNDCEMYDPFDLEFSISSPSLMRSFSSECCSEELGEVQEFDSLSEMSISPARTAIQVLPKRNVEQRKGAKAGEIENDKVQ